MNRVTARFGGGRFVRESASLGASTAAEQGSRLLTGLVAAGLLGPEAWGSWFLLNLILSYGSLLHLGSVNGMNREVPAAIGKGLPERANKLERVCLAVIALSLSLAAVLLAFAAILPSVREAVPVTHLVLMLGLLASHQLYAFVLTRGRSRMKFSTVSRQQTVFAVGHAIFAISGALAGGLVGFIIGQAVAYLVPVLLMSAGSLGLVRPMISGDDALALMRVGMPIMLVGVVHTFFMTVDRWIVAGLLGNEALGHYSIAIMTVSAMRLLPQVFSQQIYPRMAHAWSARRDIDELRMLGRRQGLMTIATFALLALPGALIAPNLIRAFLPDYVPGIGAALVVLLVPAVSSLSLGFGNVLNVVDRQGTYLALISVSTVVNAAVSLALVYGLGLVGVALGTVTGFLALHLGLLFAGTRALSSATSRAEHSGVVKTNGQA